MHMQIFVIVKDERGEMAGSRMEKRESSLSKLDERQEKSVVRNGYWHDTIESGE